MWLPSILFLVFFIGAKADPIADILEKCVPLLDGKELEEILFRKTLEGEEQLNAACTTLTEFINCINDVAKDYTELNLDELADLLKGTNEGKAVTLLVNLKNILVDLCTESELRTAYLKDLDCYTTIGLDPDNYCKSQAIFAYEAYKEFEDKVQEEAGENSALDDEQCMTLAYEMGCLGAIVHGKCGDRAFETFKKIVERIGLFKVGLCSETTMTKIKTSFADSLEMTSSRRELFRKIFSMKRRRK